MTDSTEPPTPAALRDLARAALEPCRCPDPDDDLLVGCSRCDARDYLVENRFFEQVIALVDRLEDMARLVPNCDLPDAMPTTDDVMHTPLEPNHD